MRMSVVVPAPLGSEPAHDLPWLDGQVQADDRDQVAEAAGDSDCAGEGCAHDAAVAVPPKVELHPERRLRS